jgi:hypothetical protein
MIPLILSITGLFKTVLIIVGIMVILRFVGKVMNGKHNYTAQKKHTKEKEAFDQAKEASKRNIGKVSIKKGNVPAEDVDFEEVD